VAVYIGIGLIIGTFAAFDIAGEDAAIGFFCTTREACLSHNAYLIPAVMVIWPVFAVYQPIVQLIVVIALAVAIWLMNRKKSFSTSPHK
jgi:hypothetical protein